MTFVLSKPLMVSKNCQQNKKLKVKKLKIVKNLLQKDSEKKFYEEKNNEKNFLKEENIL